MNAPHVADRGDEDVQKDGRKWPPRRHSGVAFEDLFVVEIHTGAVSINENWKSISD
jgi:hypothetical protein